MSDDESEPAPLDASDDDLVIENEIKAGRPKKARAAAAKKKVAVNEVDSHMVKANNKLIGHVENNDLYCSDDGGAVEVRSDPGDDEGLPSSLNLDVRPAQAPKRELGSLLGKLKKSQSVNEGNGIDA